VPGAQPLRRRDSRNRFWHFDEKIDRCAFRKHEVCSEEDATLGEIFRLRATLGRIRATNPNPKRCSEVVPTR